MNIIYMFFGGFYGFYFIQVCWKLSSCGWYILLVFISKHIEENSKFHQFLPYLRYPRLFLFRKKINHRVDTVNEFIMN